MKIAREVVRHPAASMRCLVLRQDAFRGGLHRHDHVELTWIEQGSGLRWVGDTVEPFGAGDVVLVGADLPHAWVTQGAPGRAACGATVLQFPPDWAAQRGWPELSPIDALLARSAVGLVAEGPTAEQVRQCLARLPGADGALRVALLIEALGAMAAPGASLRPLSAGRSLSARVERGPARRRRIDLVLNWIAAHLADELSVREAAALAGVSEAAFGRFFRREVGKGFVEVVNDARCSWAALRLLQEGTPIAEIAHDCGFATLSNFGAQFRRRTGVSPREFRRYGSQTLTSASPIILKTT